MVRAGDDAFCADHSDALSYSDRNELASSIRYDNAPPQAISLEEYHDLERGYDTASR